MKNTHYNIIDTLSWALGRKRWLEICAIFIPIVMKHNTLEDAVVEAYGSGDLNMPLQVIHTICDCIYWAKRLDGALPNGKGYGVE